MDEYQQGLDAFGAGDFDTAITILAGYLNEHPENVDAWNVKGSALARIGKYQAAIYCYDKVLALQPGNQKIIRNRGIVARRINENSDEKIKHADYWPEHPKPVIQKRVPILKRFKWYEWLLLILVSPFLFFASLFNPVVTLLAMILGALFGLGSLLAKKELFKNLRHLLHHQAVQ